jgi:hypothetical protein
MFSEFAVSHYEINSNGNGAMSQLIESQESGEFDYSNYPMFWVVDDTPVIEYDDGQVVFNFQIVLGDLTHDKDVDTDHRPQIISNMALIYQDFLAFLYVNPTILGSAVRIFNNGSSSGVSFEERFDDNLAGLVFNLSIKQPIKYDYCAAPLA